MGENYFSFSAYFFPVEHTHSTKILSLRKKEEVLVANSRRLLAEQGNENVPIRDSNAREWPFSLKEIVILFRKKAGRLHTSLFLKGVD